MKARFLTIFFLLLCVSFSSYAQREHLFTEGLFVPVDNSYGREAVYKDELLWHYYKGTLQKPEAGRELVLGAEASWTLMQADTSGFFRPSPNAGGDLRSPNNPAGPGRVERVPTSVSGQQAVQRPRLRSGYFYLTYQSSKEQEVLLNVRGNSAVLVNGELHAGDPYREGWLDVPVKLKKGLNEFYVRGMFVAAKLVFPERSVYLADTDLTLPDIVAGKDNANLVVGINLVNTSSAPLSELEVITDLGGRRISTSVPTIPANSTRKIPVRVDGSAIQHLGEATAIFVLSQKGKELHGQSIALRSVRADMPYRVTFISEIDGSLQYFAVNPAKGGEKPGDALFLSVHGAGVEALGQAQAYEAKEWGNLVAPTNRRPRGFNWEDWGRIDALEVLDHAKQLLQPDRQRIYLTGHSMGGHGTWFLGGTYPDKWAAIAPAAGYPTLKGYGSADGLIPESGRNEFERLLLRSSNQSDVIAYAHNYKSLGIYILHGDADRTVPVRYARQMRSVLGEFHPNFSYYEYPGGSHWYSNESVDWKPLFDYFRWHKRKESGEVNQIDFTTANPGISASYHWAAIHQQQVPLLYSRMELTRDVDAGVIKGRTTNIDVLSLDVSAFPVDKALVIELDSLTALRYKKDAQEDMLYLKRDGEQWLLSSAPPLAEKGPHRNGTFKEAFNHRMVYVYGTNGTKEENQWAIEKAKYDASSWYYRGNGAFDIVADREFVAEDYTDRNIILVGNASTNLAWDILLHDSPIQVAKGALRIGAETHAADDLGGYFIWKKPNSDTLSVGVITGTGISGMRAASANQYFAGASGFPDYMFFGLDMLKNGPEDIVAAGFYTNQWQISQ